MNYHITSSKNIHIFEFDASGNIEIKISATLAPAFKDLINRALNCFPDANPELKEFGDLLIEGKILQDYPSQK